MDFYFYVRYTRVEAGFTLCFILARTDALLFLSKDRNTHTLKDYYYIVAYEKGPKKFVSRVKGIKKIFL